jgi:outer membrane protein
MNVPSMHLMTGLCLALPIWAENRDVSLAEAQQALWENNVDIAVAKLEKQVAESQWRESKAAFYPSLDVSGNYSILTEKNHLELNLPLGSPTGVSVSRDLGDHDRWETGIDLTYPLFTGFARERQVESQKHLAQSQASREAAIRNQASLKLAGYFFAWQAAKAGLDYKEAQCALARNQLSVAETQYKQGMVTDRAVLAARSQWLTVENERLIAINQVDSLQIEAAQYLRISSEMTWKPLEKPWAMPDTLTASLGGDTASDQARPEIQSLVSQKEALASREAALRGQDLPTLGAMAGWRYANPGLNLAGTEAMGYGLAGLQLKWNLWDGGRQRMQRVQMQQKRQQIDLEMTRWNSDWKKSSSIAARQFARWRNQVSMAQAALETAEKSLQEARNKLAQGLATPTDTLETFVQAERARMLQNQSIAMQCLTFCQWKFARGETLVFHQDHP